MPTQILAPVDGSDCSVRAVEFAAQLAARFDAELKVVHFSDAETDATDIILDRARAAIADSGLDSEPELAMLEFDVSPGDQVGREILRLVDERGFDHVVMGHHGSGTIERAILGSAADTVVHDESVPVTIVP